MLTVAAADAAAREVTLVRELVRTESVLGDRRQPDGSWEWMIEDEPGVALVRITSFGERTAAEFQAACEAVESRLSGPDGAAGAVVIDLRGNAGGLLSAAVEVCDLLLDDGVIVSTRGRFDRAAEADGGLRDVRRATRGTVLADVPLAVLVDGLTASAAEVVAACLQDHGRAVVVGSRTFGKGTVQTIVPLSDSSGLVKLTTAEYIRPSRANIHRRGDDGSRETWGVVPEPGCEIAPTGRQIEAMRAWRRHRDVVATPGRPATIDASVSRGQLPRHVDAVLAVAIDAVRIPRKAAD
jgi:carboxyl-terminal processing protease